MTRPAPDVVEEPRALAEDNASGGDRRDRALLLSVFHPDATLVVQRPDGPRARATRPMRGHDEIGRIPERVAV